MRILNRYIVLDYLLIFLTALGLITFVMTVGALVKAVDLVARGISPGLIAMFFFQNIPYILSFSMPISTLFAALLLFGRLSMDNEISAMKACGISLWRMVAPLILLSILFSGICIYINCEVAPQAKYANKKLLRSAGVEEPINLLEEGRFINDFPGLMIYVGRKNGNMVKDVVAYELDGAGQIKRSVRAKRGTLEPDDENKALRVKLYDVRIEMPDATDPLDVSKTTYVNAEYYPILLDFSEMLKSGSVRRKRSAMTLSHLIQLVRYAGQLPAMSPEEIVEEKKLVTMTSWGLEGQAGSDSPEVEDDLAVALGKLLLIKLASEDLAAEKARADLALETSGESLALETSGGNLASETSGVSLASELSDEERLAIETAPSDQLVLEKSQLLIEANRRISTAIACFTFMLIGVPLGVKSHRKETSTGMVMSLAIVFAYYIFIVVAKALAEYPEFHPNLILWLPLLGTQITGLILIRRAS